MTERDEMPKGADAADEATPGAVSVEIYDQVYHLRGTDAEVTLVDRVNHHLFQPLLYQVATAALSPAR